MGWSAPSISQTSSTSPSPVAVAERIYERHRLLTDFFVRLGVDPEVAAADACKVEHDLSEETFCKIKEHVYRQPGADAPAPGSRPER